MTVLDRRAATLLALMAPFAATGARGQTPPAARPDPAAPAPSRRIDVAMLVYPGLTALDLVGPQYMFAALEGAAIHLVGKSLAPVASDTGLLLTPTATFADCPRDLAILFAPGGTDGTLAAMADPDTRAFVADRGARARYVTSVCTGALILGAAGLLEGYRATSHWAVRPVLARFGAIPTDARVVRDRNRVTGAGVTAGLDFGLAMVAELRDPATAELAQLIAEYDPHPPFAAGSPRGAPAGVVAEATGLLSDFTTRAHALAGTLRP